MAEETLETLGRPELQTLVAVEVLVHIQLVVELMRTPVATAEVVA